MSLPEINPIFQKQYEDQEIIDILLSKYGDINQALDVYENTALHYAVWLCNENLVFKLLERGANPNVRNSSHSTPLHQAANSYSYPLLHVLTEYGGNINARDDYGRRPLHLAAKANIEVWNEVVRHGPNVNAVDNMGNTAIAYFLKENQQGLKLEKFLKYACAGTDFSLLNQNGLNVLHTISRMLTFPHKVDIIRHILDNGVNVNAKSHGTGNTALHFAAQYDRDSVYCLLVKGADVFSRNNMDRTPLDLAIFARCLGTIEVIYSFVVPRNLPLSDLMMEYHRTTAMNECITVIHNRCQDEFDKMKRLKLISHPKSTTYQNLLALGEREFAKMLRNEEIMNEITNGIEDFFISFRYRFEFIFKEAKLRREAEDAAVSFLLEVWDYRMPLPCVEEIVRNLSTKELVQLSMNVRSDSGTDTDGF